MNKIDLDKIEDFDIILSKGQSAQSKLISLLNFSTEDYSHVGIVFKENGKVYVLHSTPDGTKTNGIRYDDLKTFIDLSSTYDYKILRFKVISSDLYQKIKLEFDKLKNSQVPFDFDFNNFDHSKIYCSELVCLIFKNSGLSEWIEFDMTKPIYPKYFLSISNMKVINTNKYP